MTPITREQARELAEKHLHASRAPSGSAIYFEGGENAVRDFAEQVRQQVIADLARESGAALNLPIDLHLSARQLEAVQAKHAEAIASLQAKIDQIEEERDTAATDRFDEIADLRAELEQSEERAQNILRLVKDDGFAITFQTMGQYRSALIATLNKETGHEA